jgi:hypothetical protein
VEPDAGGDQERGMRYVSLDDIERDLSLNYVPSRSESKALVRLAKAAVASYLHTEKSPRGLDQQDVDEWTTELDTITAEFCEAVKPFLPAAKP